MLTVQEVLTALTALIEVIPEAADRGNASWLARATPRHRSTQGWPTRSTRASSSPRTIDGHSTECSNPLNRVDVHSSHTDDMSRGAWTTAPPPLGSCTLAYLFLSHTPGVGVLLSVGMGRGDARHHSTTVIERAHPLGMESLFHPIERVMAPPIALVGHEDDPFILITSGAPLYK